MKIEVICARRSREGSHGAIKTPRLIAFSSTSNDDMGVNQGKWRVNHPSKHYFLSPSPSQLRNSTLCTSYPIMTNRTLRTAILVLLVSCISSFTPLVAPKSGFLVPSKTSPTTLQAAVVSSSILRPITRLLPWEKEKNLRSEAKKMRLEGAKLYRTLGVTEDASYEEITQATDELIVKYAR